MCGICGQYYYKDNQKVAVEIIQKMTGTIKNRGPDDEGYYIDGPLGFGFRRLSIIDLISGNQPMSDTDKKVWLIFNGEIYNFKKLRKELESYGHVFRTNSDTEIIIYGYKQWGKEVFHHLNGMFGLALWDSEKKRLLIARDRMGIKFVYYKIEDGCLSFGSEIRPILVCTGKPAVDPSAVNLFLRYRYTPSPLTVFEGIRKLPPGSLIIAEKGSVHIERWYKYVPQPFDIMPSIKEAEEELLALYRNAVKRQIVSDVPLGLLLSGGVDSGLLLALMNEFGKSWKTFTVGYGENFPDDEIADAGETAELLKADHYSVQIDHEVFEQSLPKILNFLEEPIASSSIVPMYHVCERARQDVKVALIGQGPDELFGGYTRHLGIMYGNYWRRLPNWLKTSAAIGLRRFTSNEAIHRGLYSLNTPDRMNRYQQVFSIVQGEVVDNLFKKDLLTPGVGDKILECWNDLEPLLQFTDELGGFQYLEIRSSLPDELLMYADKLSMAHGLELRVPYLDHDVVEYIERLPSSFKIHYGFRKWLHKKLCQDFLPRQIVRRKKRGFAVNVVDEWFRHSISKEMNSILTEEDSLMYNFLRIDMVKQMLNEHQRGLRNNHKILFSLVVFEKWLRNLDLM